MAGLEGILRESEREREREEREREREERREREIEREERVCVTHRALLMMVSMRCVAAAVLGMVGLVKGQAARLKLRMQGFYVFLCC